MYKNVKEILLPGMLFVVRANSYNFLTIVNLYAWS